MSLIYSQEALAKARKVNIVNKDRNQIFPKSNTPNFEKLKLFGIQESNFEPPEPFRNA